MVKHYAEHSPLPQELEAREVANVAAFLCSPLATGITGTTVYVDKGYHAMGVTEASAP
jgi:enoyl-[acyl-carrier protein] reductase I